MLSLELRGTPCAGCATRETFPCQGMCQLERGDGDSKALASTSRQQQHSAHTAGWQLMHLLQRLTRSQDARNRLEHNLREPVLQRSQLSVRIEG